MRSARFRTIGYKQRRNQPVIRQHLLTFLHSLILDLSVSAISKQIEPAERESVISDWLRANKLEHQIPGLLQVYGTDDDTDSRQIFWSPHHELNFKNSFFIASSRIGRKLELIPNWFDALRTVCGRLAPENQVLLTAANVSTNPYVQRAAEIFQIPLIELRKFPKRLSTRWFEKTFAATEPETSKIVVYVGHDSRSECMDEILMSVSEHVRLLSVSGNGNIYKSALRRLKKTPHPQTNNNPIWLLADDELTKHEVQEELIAAGACPWWLYKTEPIVDAPVSEQEKATSLANQNRTPCDIVSKHELNLDEYLLHWTRRQNDSWPGQSPLSAIDNLLFGSPFASQDRLATLCQILATGKLIAGGKLTRDSTPVVCFSGVIADQLPERRIFRSHLSRWDFETVGIAIRKDVLQSLGAKKVIYGDDDCWYELSPEQRPLFQLQQSKTKNGVIDWREEKEWRVIGDVDLRRLKTTDAFLFVSNDEEANVVAKLSRWPVLVLQPPASKTNPQCHS